MPKVRASRISVRVRRRPETMPKLMESRQRPKARMGTRARLKAEGKSEPVAESRMAWGISVSRQMMAA